MPSPVPGASEPTGKRKGRPPKEAAKATSDWLSCHAARGNASGSTPTPDYYRLAARAESDPDAHALTVYDGRHRCGAIIEIAGARHAFGPLDEALGRYPTR